jgi:tetratricopeptide (TPR) repeat protein
MHDSLDFPDLPEWHDLVDYSDEVAARLRRAYALIASGGSQTAAYLHAAREIQRAWALSMAEPQRLRVCYVLVLAYTADKQYDQAFDWVEHGIELSAKLDDMGALARLLYLRGTLGFVALEFAEASDDIAESRMLLRALNGHGPRKDPSMELDLLITEANLRSFMGQFDHARALLAMARQILARLSGHVLEGATISWLDANMLRWQGRSREALPLIRSAASIYTSLGSANSTARVQVAAVETMLDLADAQPLGTERDRFLRRVYPHLSLALNVTKPADREAESDPTGRVLVRLTEMRYLRLTGANTDRVDAVERLAREAQELGDHALVAQSFTALAEELASQSEPGSAASMYREALGVLDGSDLRSLTIWPWRGLARLDRQNVKGSGPEMR